MSLTLDMTWHPGWDGAPLLSRTAGFLLIDVNGRVATRNDNEWAHSVHDRAFLAAYPVALWVVGSWWRLLYEPPPGASPRSPEWRMTHELAAAGEGFVWPNLCFEPEGPTVEIVSVPSAAHPAQPLRYLEAFRERLEVQEIEGALVRWVELVLRRLEMVGLPDSDLATLWAQLTEERRDGSLAEYRRLEAQLGYDPDEAPTEVMSLAAELRRSAGSDALAEIAPACAQEPATMMPAVRALAESDGFTATVPGLGSGSQLWQIGRAQLIADVLKGDTVGEAPWRRGSRLAAEMRRHWMLDGEPISSADFAGLLDMEPDALGSHPASSHPMGLAVRGAGGLTLHFRGGHPQARRFEAARFLADALTAPKKDRWLPVTSLPTARQKLQRAFAAEFLAPAEGIREFIQGDTSDEALEEAAAHFGVSSLAIRHQVINHGLAST
jgi:hypothetical protein